MRPGDTAYCYFADSPIFFVDKSVYGRQSVSFLLFNTRKLQSPLTIVVVYHPSIKLYYVSAVFIEKKLPAHLATSRVGHFHEY